MTLPERPSTSSLIATPGAYVVAVAARDLHPDVVPATGHNAGRPVAQYVAAPEVVEHLLEGIDAFRLPMEKTSGAPDGGRECAEGLAPDPESERRDARCTYAGAARAERGAVTGKGPRGHGYLGGLIIAGIGRTPGQSSSPAPGRVQPFD